MLIARARARGAWRQAGRHQHIPPSSPRSPVRIAAATDGVDAARLHERTADEPWSVNDILAHCVRQPTLAIGSSPGWRAASTRR